MDISKRIAAFREAKGFTQKQIADLLEMEQSNYSRLEKRGNKLTVEQLEKIAGVLGVTVTELLTGEAQKVEDSEEVEGLRKRVRELEEDKKNQQKLINMYESLKPLVHLLEEFERLEHDPVKVEEFLNKEASMLEDNEEDESLISTLKPFVLAWIYRMVKKKL